MIQSYFKLALKVLSRKKFFTFISLFGISFTLMILMMVTAFLDNQLGEHSPLSQKDKMVFLPMVEASRIVPDTTLTVDSTLIDGNLRYDTITTIGEETRSVSTSSLSFKLIDQHLRDLQGTTKYTFYGPGRDYTVFKNNKKITFSFIYTDAAYWDIFDFEWIEGQPYREQEVTNEVQSIVISDKAAATYFGKTKGLVGEEIEIDKKHYKITGVIKKPTVSLHYVQADIFLPYTQLPPFVFTNNEPNMGGGFEAVFLATNSNNRQLIKDDLNRIAAQFQMPDPESFNKLKLEGLTFRELYTHSLLRRETVAESFGYAKWVLISLLSLFILLPTLNLININISRILERASEIGVRKSFGADSSTILFQFVFENLILTLIGGVIGLVLAYGLIYLINESQALENTTLRFNGSVFLYSFLICLAFGVLSGIIPAYRMSKMQISESLKQNQL